jgi:DnaK suppressor protein
MFCPNNMDKTSIREIVEKELGKTRKIVEEYRDLTKPIAPDCAIGRVSRMDAINNKSITEAALKQAEVKLERLVYVIENIDNPNFGKCSICGQQIPIGRILIRPESLQCVRCAR